MRRSPNQFSFFHQSPHKMHSFATLFLVLVAALFLNADVGNADSLQQSLRTALRNKHREIEVEDFSSINNTLVYDANTTEVVVSTEPTEIITAPECYSQNATQNCQSNFALASFGVAQVWCCPVLAGDFSNVITGNALTQLGSGRSRGVWSSGFVTYALPAVNGDTFDIELNYAQVPNVPTKGCNELTVLLDQTATQVPEIRCIKKTEVIQSVWMYTKLGSAELRFGVRCCELDM